MRTLSASYSHMVGKNTILSESLLDRGYNDRAGRAYLLANFWLTMMRFDAAFEAARTMQRKKP